MRKLLEIQIAFKPTTDFTFITKLKILWLFHKQPHKGGLIGSIGLLAASIAAWNASLTP